MPNKFFVIYNKTLGIATARPVVSVLEEDEGYDPTAYFPDMGLSTATHGVVALDDWDWSTADDTQNIEATVDPTAKTLTQTAVTAQTLEQRQALASTRLNALKREVAYTQLLNSRQTVASRNAFKDYMAALDAVPMTLSGLWGMNPEGVFADPGFPVKPAEATEATDLADRLASLMGNRSIAPIKLTPYDSTNMTPLGSFDTPDTSLYSVSNLPVPTFTTATKSGGYALTMGPKTDSAFYGVVGLLAEDYVPVEENETLVFRASWRAAQALTTYAGAFQLAVAYLDADHVRISGAGSTLINTDATGSWQTKEVQTVVPANAKFAGWEVRIPPGAQVNAQVRVDAVSMRKVISSEQIAVGATSNFVASDGNSGSIGSTATLPAGGTIMASTGSDAALVAGRGARRILVMASVQINRNANGDVVRLNLGITGSKNNGAEFQVAYVGQWGFQEGGYKTFAIMGVVENDPGASYSFRLKGAKAGSHVGGDPSFIEAAITAIQLIT